MIKNITSSVQKEVRALHRKKGRDNKRRFLVEGVRIVEEAVEESANVDYVVVAESFDMEQPLGKLLIDRGVNIYISTDKVMKELSDTDTPQGIIACVKYIENSPILDEDMIVILDSIQDPGNMGTILRTADAVGVNRVIVSRGCVDIYNPKVTRSTMGSIFRVPIERANDLVDAIVTLKRDGYKVIVTHLGGKKDLYDVDLRNKVAIVIGNEANGVHDDVANICDELIKIPMRGKTESLNASVSGAVVMYEALRQKMQHKECLE